ncbi:MAG: PilZ domain-containing protein, partial [Planctomycetes bacterium]|nr:PilZ domain-containing protein [Planctomycetota bacterium]
MPTDMEINNDRAERIAKVSAVEFIVDGDIIEGASVNISETGLRIDTSQPLTLTLRFVEDNEQKNYRSQLVWASKKEG